MRNRFLSVLMALSMPLWAASALAQDMPAEEPSPEAGDMGDTGGDMGGDPVAEGDASGELASEDTGGGSKPISVGLLVGYGLDLEDGPLNPWGLGFGARGGYNLDQIFLGVRFVFYLGGEEGGVSSNVWELGLEGGYDIDAGGVTIRPGLGLGLASVSSEITLLGMSVSGSDSYLYLAPGASLLFDVSDDIFVGADVRFQMIFADPDMVKALIMLANAGMRF
jgi:hypothetical protein